MDIVKRYWIELIGILILLFSLIPRVLKANSGYEIFLNIFLFAFFIGIIFVGKYYFDKQDEKRIQKEEQEFFEAVDELKNSISETSDDTNINSSNS